MIQLMEDKIFSENNNINSENKLLLNIYLNNLYPPPIGIYTKDLNFDSALNLSNLSPVLYGKKQIILGDGSFSKVKLYEDKKTKMKYAIKKMNILKLEKISKNKKLVNNEINIQGRIKHPNIIRLYNFYKYKNDYYLILEYASKGTLFDIIRQKSGLTESMAFYYFIQALNAIYFLHLHSIIHRDLKPENLLINNNNILKLCDFGWGVKLKSNKRTTFCGTVEYMAPEMIKKQKYDETIDIWSLGVLLYELVHSYSPFCSEDLDIKKIGNNIIQNKLIFQEGLSEEYKDLVNKILIKDSSKRIKIEEIYNHPFMTKYINIIYKEINSNIYTTNLINAKNNKNYNKINQNNSININDKGCFYKKIKKTANGNKNNELKNNNQYIDNKLESEKKNRDTNFLFDSIPSEPEPKLIPASNCHKDIKKINTHFFINKNLNITLLDIQKKPLQIIPNTSRNKRNIVSSRKKQKIKSLFKYENTISHVKSFSLGQNAPNSTKLKNKNRLKIIIRINNTKNKNYIVHHEKTYKNKKNLSSKNAKSFSNVFDKNHFKSSSKLGINKNNKNNKSYINKNINQTFLFEHKNYLNSNTNSKNNVLKYNQIYYDDGTTKRIKKIHRKNIYDEGNNYIKTENNIHCQNISLINDNKANNFSNTIIFNNKSSSKNSTKKTNVFKLKKIIKNSHSLNDYSKFIRTINYDSFKKLRINNNLKKEESSNQEKIEKIKNMNDYKNINKYKQKKKGNKVKTHINSKSSIINKIINTKLKKNLSNTININYNLLHK